MIALTKKMIESFYNHSETLDHFPIKAVCIFNGISSKTRLSGKRILHILKDYLVFYLKKIIC
jgi:hypothetical protein